MNAAVGTKRGDNKPALEVSHAGNVETDTVVHTDFPESSKATIDSSAAKDKTIASKEADSTDVGNYVRNLTSTGEPKTSATEHCNYKARHTHKCLCMVLPIYSKIQVLPGITSCRLMKYNKPAVDLNDLLKNIYAKDAIEN